MTLNIAQLFGDPVPRVEPLPPPPNTENVPTTPASTEPVRERVLCPRCENDEATLHIIHDGDSIRRDCARCGRFIDFPVWYDRNTATSYIESQQMCG